ncbi:hypothetical protein Q5752_006926 [Cryptotrichosporon argae]
MSTSFPETPARPYVKPTWANTDGGKTYEPTHAGLFQVEFQAPTAAGGDFSSRAVATKDFKSGETITKLDNLSHAKAKAYSSVQHGPGEHDHFELNSDLLFLNHSCAPSTELVLPRDRSAWIVRACVDIKAGDDLTFFYPSTEWDMAQGFDCSCGATDCLGRIRGARYLSIDELEKRGYVNEHIIGLKRAGVE